jgi:hypothetical protein
MQVIQKVTLTVDVNELNVLLAGLGKLPYEQVFQVFNKVAQQAQDQLGPQQPAAGSGALGAGEDQ